MGTNKIAVLGAGSWGIALANQCRRLGSEVSLWGRDKRVLEEVRNTGAAARFFGAVHGVSGIVTTDDMAAALQGAQIVIVAVPSSAVRAVISSGVSALERTALLVSAAKGLEEGTDFRMTEVFRTVAPERDCGVLTGPSFAVEVLKNSPTAVTFAAEKPELAERVRAALHGERFRVYAISDVIGAELGGTLKNVLAIAAGIVDGAELGVNARAALLTRGLAELRRLVVAAGGQADTVVGLSGLGDLLLTATSDLSRNRRVGLALGKGGELKSTLAQIGQVAEGVQCAKQVVELGKKLKVELPISEQVLELLEGKKSLRESVDALFSRAPGRE